MFSATYFTIKNGANFDSFYSIKVSNFQISARGRFENDPHGRRGGGGQNNILGKFRENGDD